MKKKRFRENDDLFKDKSDITLKKKKRKVENFCSPELPNEIHLQILSFVDISSSEMLPLRCVCKLWNYFFRTAAISALITLKVTPKLKEFFSILEVLEFFPIKFTKNCMYFDIIGPSNFCAFSTKWNKDISIYKTEKPEFHLFCQSRLFCQFLQSIPDNQNLIITNLKQSKIIKLIQPPDNGDSPIFKWQYITLCTLDDNRIMDLHYEYSLLLSSKYLRNLSRETCTITLQKITVTEKSYIHKTLLKLTIIDRNDSHNVVSNVILHGFLKGSECCVMSKKIKIDLLNFQILRKEKPISCDYKASCFDLLLKNCTSKKVVLKINHDLPLYIEPQLFEKKESSYLKMILAGLTDC